MWFLVEDPAEASTNSYCRLVIGVAKLTRVVKEFRLLLSAVVVVAAVFVIFV